MSSRRPQYHGDISLATHAALVDGKLYFVCETCAEHHFTDQKPVVIPMKSKYRLEGCGCPHPSHFQKGALS